MPRRADSPTGPGSARPIRLGIGCVVYYIGALILIAMICFAAIATAKGPDADPPPARYFATLFSSLTAALVFGAAVVALVAGSLLLLGGLEHRVRVGTKFHLRHVLIAVVIAAIPLASPYAATPFVALILFQGPMILACLAALGWTDRSLVAREPLPPRTALDPEGPPRPVDPAASS